MTTNRPDTDQNRFHLARAFGHLCFWVTTAVLALLLVLQGVLLVRGSWNVPALLVSHLRMEMIKQGWQADYTRLDFHLPASVTVIEPRLRRIGQEDPLVEANYGRVDFSLSQLLRGHPQVKSARLYGGTLFCPAPHSPTGVREKVIESAYVSVRNRHQTWMIETLLAKTHNLAISATGSIPHPATKPPPPEETPPLDWDSLLATFLPRIIREQPNFSRVDHPILRLHFLPQSAHAFTVRIDGWAQALSAPHGIQITRPHLHATARFDGADWQGEWVSLQAATVSWESHLTAHGLHSQLEWAPIRAGPNLIPDRGTLTISELETPAGSIDGFATHLALAPADRIQVDLSALFQKEPIMATGELDWHSGNGKFNVLSRVNPTPLMQHETTRALGIRRTIGFEESPLGAATVWIKNWQLDHARAHAHARLANIDGVLLDWATARAELRPDRFIVPEMVLNYGDFEALGSYEVDFETLDYRLRFKGQTRPLHIQAWFRDWWANLWNEFEFPQEPLSGDLDIHGRHGNSDEARVFGSVKGTNFNIRGVAFESFSGTLRVAADDVVDLFHIDLRRAEGPAEGWFRYRPHPVTKGFGQLDFEAHSRVDPIGVAPIFGEAGVGMLSSFSFTSPPALLLTGSVYGHPQQKENRVTITGQTESPLVYQGLALDRLMVDMLVEGSDWNLRQIDAGLAGGRATGDARKWMTRLNPDEDEVEKLQFSLIMEDLATDSSIELIKSWQAAAGLEEKIAEPSLHVGGLIDLDLQAEGLFGDFQSFRGEGNLKIREANLGEIHLLGILSRLLKVTPIGFTSLQFTEADSQFIVALNKLTFNGLRLNGPSSEIRATGTYLMDEDNLDFSLRLRFISESRIPLLSLLLSPVLEPLAHILEIRLTGSPSDPQWRFLLGPRNIFKEMTGEGGSPSSPNDESAEPEAQPKPTR
jgi:hypothetical protein